MANNAVYANIGTYGVNDQPQVGPLMQAQSGVLMLFTLADLTGTPIDITHESLSGTITNNLTSETAELTGALAIVDGAAGVFSWTTADEDVSTAGEFTLLFVAGVDIRTLPAHLSIIETPGITDTFDPLPLVGVTAAERAWLTAALAQLPDGNDFAYIPNPQGATDGHIWTADGADGADWEAPAAVDIDDLTTGTGNSGEMVRVAAAGGLEYRTPAQVLGDIGAAASASLTSYLPKTAGSGEAVTGVLYLDPGSDDTATLLRVPVTASDGADICVTTGATDFDDVTDVTFNLGFNNGSSGALDQTKHAWYSQWEYRYNTSGTEWAEHHLNLLGANGAFGFRPVEYKFDVTGASGTISFRASTVNWQSITDYQVMRLTLGANAAASELNVYAPLTIRNSQYLQILGGSAIWRSPSDTKGLSISVDDGGNGSFSASSATENLQFNNFLYVQFPGVVLDSTLADFSTHVNVASGKTYQVNSVQVVGARVIDARCSGAINSGDATTDDVIDALRDAMITHGLIAAA